MAKRKFKSKVTEYNYYAKLINRNLKKLSKEFPESRALERYRGEFEPITTPNANKRVVSKLLKKAKDLWSSGATSVKSEKRAVALAIDTLKSRGIDYVNKRNFKYFYRFLDDARARGLGSLYSSTQLIEAIKEAKDKGLSKADIKANIEYWARKELKYDKEGRLIEPNSYQSLKVISGKRLENYKAKAKDRAKREAKRGY